MPVNRPEILILGGGILGSATAWQLALRGVSEVVVLDLDLAGTFGSSELNAGGCRATWWNTHNVGLSWDSIQFYQGLADEIQFFQKGYLFLYHPTPWRTALAKKIQYESRGIPVHYLETAEIKKHLPEFENLTGVAGATYSPKDGLLDPHLLKEFYRSRARDKGVRFLDRYYVSHIALRDGRVRQVDAIRHPGPGPGEEELLHILTTHRPPAGDGWEKTSLHPRILINCTGAWLGVTSGYYQRPLPVRPLRRQISLFSSHEEDFSDRGMIVDASGLYLHAEGRHSGLVLAGYSNPDEKPGYRFHYDGQPFFDRKIWLRLYRRGARKHFGALRHIRGWAGLYAVGPDKTGILWRVEGIPNLYELGAATGRGVMQSYALGRGMAELVTQGRFETLDLTPLSGKRFQEEKFQEEHLDI